MTAHAIEQCIHCYSYYYSKTARLATSDAMPSRVSELESGRDCLEAMVRQGEASF